MSHSKKLTTDDEIERIEEALLALPARTRDVFLLHRLDGLGYGEIAARFGISEARVGADIAEAILAIDRALEEALERPRRPWWRCLLDRWR